MYAKVVSLNFGLIPKSYFPEWNFDPFLLLALKPKLEWTERKYAEQNGIKKKFSLNIHLCTVLNLYMCYMHNAHNLASQ